MESFWFIPHNIYQRKKWAITAALRTKTSHLLFHLPWGKSQAYKTHSQKGNMRSLLEKHWILHWINLKGIERSIIFVLSQDLAKEVKGKFSSLKSQAMTNMEIFKWKIMLWKGYLKKSSTLWERSKLWCWKIKFFLHTNLNFFSKSFMPFKTHPSYSTWCK